ncbi:MAG: hypothetical protein NTX03_08755 [Bacteroidetes bacterium]|nr:hypothetical protein [Bacteroidota bacterium]
MKKTVKILVLFVLSSFAFMAFKPAPMAAGLSSIVENKCYLGCSGVSTPCSPFWHFGTGGSSVQVYYVPSNSPTPGSRTNCGWAPCTYSGNTITFTANIPSTAGGGTIAITATYNKFTGEFSTTQTTTQAGRVVSRVTSTMALKPGC